MVFNISYISFRNVITKWLHFRVKYYNLQNFSLNSQNVGNIGANLFVLCSILFWFEQIDKM